IIMYLIYPKLTWCRRLSHTFSSIQHDPLRALHSFPTRLSSDLSARWSSSCDPAGGTPRWGSSTPSTWSRSPPSPSRSCLTWWRRSEEHTSELQSRENLVCRLLLEKKNKYNIIHY